MYLKTVLNFLKSYKLLSFIAVFALVGLILYFFKLNVLSNWVLGITVIIAVIPLLWDMATTLRNGKYGIDILAATAMITSVLLGQYWTGIIIAIMLTGGEALEDFAENRAKAELKNLLDNKPKIAHLVKGKIIKDVALSHIKVGDRLSILPGEVVPVDCELIEGETSFNEASITGESLPVDKWIGDQVLSGAINIEGAIQVKAIRTAANSQYEQIIKLVEAAASTESPFVRLADKYSIPFTALAYFIAGSVWLMSGHAIRFLEVIVVATPCPLLLAAPIALISGMSRAAKHGIIIKNGSSLERLAQIETIAFDKTGTLTTGKPVVDQIYVFKPYSKNDLLKYASAIEQSSNHVLASAITQEATKQKITIHAAKQVKELAGHGLSGRLQGKHIMIGRWSLMQENRIIAPKNFKINQIKTTATYVAIDNKLAGVITFIDALRPESKNLLLRLKKAGVEHILMITGDNINTANAIARKLGIKEVRADCLPADKMKIIEDIEDRPVAFVGDGVNDAPVLTLSDVGIALGASGSTAASESADVVIMLDDVSKVASGVEIAKRTFFIAKQSILIGIIISIGLMGIFATGHLKPIYGALLQELVDVIVIFNALRAHSIWQSKIAPTREKGL